MNLPSLTEDAHQRSRVLPNRFPDPGGNNTLLRNIAIMRLSGIEEGYCSTSSVRSPLCLPIGKLSKKYADKTRPKLRLTTFRESSFPMLIK